MMRWQPQGREVSSMANSPRARFRRQVRNFTLIWAGITFIMGVTTFIAIYAAYGSLTGTSTGDTLRNVAIPTGTVGSDAAVVSTSTPRPTIAPTSVTPETVAQAATQPPNNTPAPTATLLPVDVKRFQLGVQVQVSMDNMDQWTNVAKNQLSVNWVKEQVRWKDTEKTQGTFDWFETDTYLTAAASQGLKVLVSVVTAPDWARESGADTTQNGPPANPQDYANFVVALLRRYPGKIHAVEVWNEENLDREWTSTKGLSAANYVELLHTTYQAVKAVDPGVIVVSGALAPTGLNDGTHAFDDFVYMDALIAAGLLNYTDCVGAHHNGYNVSPDYTYDAIPNDPNATFRGPFDNPHHSWSFRSTLQTYAAKIAQAPNNNGQKLCITEFGWPSGEGLTGVPDGFGFATDNTLEEQRDFTVKALDYMKSSDFVWLAFLWNLNYGPQAGWAADNDNVPYSIIGPNFQFRPVFDAVRDWNRAYEATQTN
ncbi:MAG: cellulase family glycosylhydrolase [Chloroflexi bacterium]|nr:cellulase family glycosylhydrolase [Chloroflexota bacterium]